MWHFSADTGGTFTDCFAITPEGLEKRCKVLSSGSVRTRLIGPPRGHALKIAETWGTSSGFFAGFEICLVSNPLHRCRVLGWDPDNGTLTLDEPAPTSWQEDGLVELSTGEEAPVLGMRLLTGTAIGQAFPPLAVRVATTRATNALLERKGSRVALFITQGFADLLTIGDQRRADLFALKHESRSQFHECAVEVRERLDRQGRVLIPLDEAELKRVAAENLKAGITHAAVALMHSFVNPAHEKRVAELFYAEGFEHVSLSSELAPFAKILPRAQSAVANAYLTGPVQSFLEGVGEPLGKISLHVMTSAGGLEPASTIKPKDMLLSGPAGGAIGAANAARRAGFDRIITFDMGGTSTDVARLEGRPGYRFSQSIAGMNLLAPCIAVETVAAGGGSICAWTPAGLEVGPHSAGSNPGPACYGKGGPLTITDVNLLLGRFDPSRSPIPLDREAAQNRLTELREKVSLETGRSWSATELLNTLLGLAVEHMADAIRKISVAEGYSPKEYALLAFGGAGPQHACAVAALLGIDTIIVPRHAGILSAVGLHEAVPEAFAEKQVLMEATKAQNHLSQWITDMVAEAKISLNNNAEIAEPHVLAEMRLMGQDTPLQVQVTSQPLSEAFSEAYARLFGYSPPQRRVVELVSLRVVVKAVTKDVTPLASKPMEAPSTPGPALIQDAFSTLIIEAGWTALELDDFGYLLRRDLVPVSAVPPAAAPDLLRHRFHSLVDDMGALLKRTSISTNIRERLDFSCALLNARGELVASAPHIPVHLGALGVCVRETLNVLGWDAISPGDTYITNHPAFGGSHLPDVTLITPVFSGSNELLGFVANRAHHAEIGGMTPGSMPATATHLIEEGVVIAPRHLVRAGVSQFDEIAGLLSVSKYPTRQLADNLADLHAQLAANRLGAERLRELGSPYVLEAAMDHVLDHSARMMARRLELVPAVSATEHMDDGAMIRVAISQEAGRLKMDFTGTSATHHGNLNATRAIVSSAVLYVLRLMLQEDLPLNEGLIRPVELILPPGTMLNPVFSGDSERDPAVVGGNVEVSQRLVDTLIKAFGLQACSQGTMNNLLFGNEHFGYYETIAGGAGAGEGYEGASALHTHMTNTAITDPEILEQRYPVRLRQFSVRRGSGGAGRWRGGDGVVREFEFLEPLTVSLLTQHRTAGPFGVKGGQPGQAGKQTLRRVDGEVVTLPASVSLAVQRGDVLVMETPGGGGWAAATS